MNSKVLTVTVSLMQLLIENLDKLEAQKIYRQKLKQTGNQFKGLLMKEIEKIFSDLSPELQEVFFEEIKTLECIISEYQDGTLKVIADEA